MTRKRSNIAGDDVPRAAALRPKKLIKQNWLAHTQSATHKRAKDMRAELESEAQRSRNIGENLVRLVLQTIREAGSRQDFERKVVDFYKMGGRVGRFNHSEKFMKASQEQGDEQAAAMDTAASASQPEPNKVFERPQPRPRGGNRVLALTAASMLSPDCIPGYTAAGRRGVEERRRRLGQSPTHFNSVTGIAAGAACWAPRIDAAARAGDGGVGWGAVDHLSDMDMVHMPAEMSMETVVPIDFQEAWAEAQRCVNERMVAAAVEAGDPVVLDIGR
eukprot:jgi/Tetstr1/453186/TSEL_040203.t1